MNFLASLDNFKIYYVSEGDNSNEKIGLLDEKIKVFNLNLKEVVKNSQSKLPIINYFKIQKNIKTTFKNIINKIQPDIITCLDGGVGYRLQMLPMIKTKSIKVLECHMAYEFERQKIIEQKNRFRQKNILEKVKDKVRPSSLFRKDNDFLHSNYDHIITLTNEDLVERGKINVPKTRIYNFKNSPKNITTFGSRKNIVLAVGGLDKNKNFNELIKAVSLIKNHISEWEFHIYGEGNEFNKLKESISIFKLDDIIKLKGYSLEMDSVYKTAKILVSTALTEAFGMTILEAFSYNIPVISYDCKSGPKEIIRDGVNGYLVEVNDTQTLADKILKLISNHQLLEEFSANTSLDLHKFDKEKIMQEWINFYEEIVNEK